MRNAHTHTHIPLRREMENMAEELDLQVKYDGIYNFSTN